MKGAIAILGLGLLGGLVFLRQAPRSPEAVPSGPTPRAAAAAPVQAAAEPPGSTTNDSLKIFRSAFWRSPLAGDEILHAERREWLDGQGVTKWQWFIVLHPSPELLKYVREDNAFGLVRLESPRPVEQAPAWFRFDPAEVEVMGAPRSNLQFIFSDSGNLLFAAHSGDGFTRGAAPPSPSAPPPPRHDGRLPRTPPPNPAAASGSTSARGPGARSASPD